MFLLHRNCFVRSEIMSAFPLWQLDIRLYGSSPSERRRCSPPGAHQSPPTDDTKIRSSWKTRAARSRPPVHQPAPSITDNHGRDNFPPTSTTPIRERYDYKMPPSTSIPSSESVTHEDKDITILELSDTESTMTIPELPMPHGHQISVLIIGTA